MLLCYLFKTLIQMLETGREENRGSIWFTWIHLCRQAPTEVSRMHEHEVDILAMVFFIYFIVFIRLLCTIFV